MELDKLPKEVKDIIWKTKADKGLLGNKKPRKVNAVDNSQERNSGKRSIVKWGSNIVALERYQGWGESTKGGKQGRCFGSNDSDDKDVTEVNNANGWTGKK